jgi:hypothetical protein
MKLTPEEIEIFGRYIELLVEINEENEDKKDV